MRPKGTAMRVALRGRAPTQCQLPRQARTTAVGRKGSGAFVCGTYYDAIVTLFGPISGRAWWNSLFQGTRRLLFFFDHLANFTVLLFSRFLYVAFLHALLLHLARHRLVHVHGLALGSARFRWIVG